MALIYNATFDKNTRKLSFEDRAGNEIYSFTVPERGPVDDITKPLTFRATQDGSTVKLTSYYSPRGDFQTSRDGGNTWSDYPIGSKITLNIGDEVSFRAKADRTSKQGYSDYFYFMMEGKIEAWHNVMSLYRTNDFATYESVVEYAFQRLFRDCTSLTKAPALPATTLALYCYNFMFANCQSLTKSPELPATTLASDCYRGMFDGCRNLNEVRCKMPSSYSADVIWRFTEGTTDPRYPWLKGVASTGTFYTNADANWPSGRAGGIPEGWTRDPAVDDITKPLTFKATQDGSTVTLKKVGSPDGAFQTSTDGGSTWTDYTLNTAIALNTGDEVSFRAKADRTSAQSSQNYFYFIMEGKIEAWHNVMSLYRTNDFSTYESVVECGLRDLFFNCTSLTKAPALPATTLAKDCYEFMFVGCQSLTKAPELPATTLVSGCYASMFKGCQSLTKAPVLPATKLEQWCYYHMFDGCLSLTEAPELPVTTLADSCYDSMFYGCRSLTKAPELPATTLAGSCYFSMFAVCPSLKEVRVSATTTATDALNSWLYGVSATGDFYCDPNATIFPTDNTSGIPSGWTRHALADYPVTLKV